MYPDFSYVLHAIIGTDPDNWTSIVKTFGLLLATSILTAAYILFLEIKRKESQGLLKPISATRIIGNPVSPMDLVGNAILGFVLGFKIVYIFYHFADFQADAAAVVLSAKGNWIAGIIGALIFGGFKFWEKNGEKEIQPMTQEYLIYPHDRIGDITMVAAISGIIGAKVFAVIEDLESFFQDPIGQFFSGSGMAIYGGLIGGFIGVFIYLKRKNINPIHIMDAVAPALIIAYGIGRLGCHFSGDGDWGIVNSMAQPSWFFLPDWLWAYDYPQNVLNEGVQIEGCEWDYCKRLTEPRYPTPIYEFIMALGIGGILWALRKRIKIPGMLFFIYLIFNGFERFWIEKIRVNDEYQILGFQSTQAEFIAVVLMIIGLVGCLFLWLRRDQKVA